MDLSLNLLKALILTVIVFGLIFAVLYRAFFASATSYGCNDNCICEYGRKEDEYDCTPENGFSDCCMIGIINNEGDYEEILGDCMMVKDTDSFDPCYICLDESGEEVDCTSTEAVDREWVCYGSDDLYETMLVNQDECIPTCFQDAVKCCGNHEKNTGETWETCCVDAPFNDEKNCPGDQICYGSLPDHSKIHEDYGQYYGYCVEPELIGV